MEILAIALVAIGDDISCSDADTILMHQRRRPSLRQSQKPAGAARTTRARPCKGQTTPLRCLPISARPDGLARKIGRRWTVPFWHHSSGIISAEHYFSWTVLKGLEVSPTHLLGQAVPIGNQMAGIAVVAELTDEIPIYPQ